jgi:ABC-type sugar transport system substrate-binding protein/uncharacterized protein YceK
MKKILAILLALVMVLSLVACGSSSDDDSSSESKDTTASDTSTSDTSDSTGGDADTSGDSATNPLSAAAGMGFYDADYDYSANKKFKFAYMVVATNFLYEEFSDSFARWGERLNMEYTGIYSASGDSDLFVTTIETYATQGYDGVIVDPDTQTWARVSEVCEESGMYWMPAMSQPVDIDGNVVHPCVGFDNTQFGRDMAYESINYAIEHDGITDLSKVGFISVDYSASDQIHERTTGAQEYIEENYPEITFFWADCVAEGMYGMTSDGAYNQTAPIVAANPDIEYWCVAAAIDDMAIGSARALDENGFPVGKANVTTCGGSSLIAEWDEGVESSWVSAIYTAQDLYAEPIVCALYAFMTGEATPETIWPDWNDPNDDSDYAKLLLNSFAIYKDNYTEYLEFVDSYTGLNTFNYDYNGTQYDNDHAGPY